MTVTSIKEISDGKAGTDQGVSNAEIVRAFRVTTDNKFDTPHEIAPALPIGYGTTLAVNPNFIALAVDYDMVEQGPFFSVWIVSFRFRTVAIDSEILERQLNPNPLNRRARIVIRSVRYEKLTDLDRDGFVKRNSAGDAFEPKEKDAMRWVINVRKNYASIPDFVWTYQNSLNAAPVTIRGRLLAAETLKFGEVIAPELRVENGTEFFPVEFTLDYRSEGWKAIDRKSVV